jgi:hypothetical protein
MFQGKAFPLISSKLRTDMRFKRLTKVFRPQPEPWFGVSCKGSFWAKGVSAVRGFFKRSPNGTETLAPA